MNGPIHEMILLALSVQADLQGDEAAMARFWPEHPAVQYTQQVTFAERAGRARERILAEDPPAWAALLRAGGVTSVRIDHVAQTDAPMDRMTSGFVGGGRQWRIYTSNGKHHDAWEPRVALDREARETMIKSKSLTAKIWRSSYLRRTARKHGPFDADVEGASDALARALRDAIAFSEANQIEGWAHAAFEPALDVLEKRTDVDPDRDWLDFAPFARNPLSGRLLNAVLPAWVFGGMGSWNDQSFSDETVKTEYERVSEALYQTVHRAIAAAVNGNV